MPSFSSLFLSTLTIAVSLAQAHCSTINWRPCEFNGTRPILCGNLSVPLDYTDAKSNATLRLELVKVPAAKTPSKGSILFNFGGPGEEAQQTMAQVAAELQILTGGHHDLIAFDPRGTGKTMVVSCYQTDIERLVGSLQAPGWSNASDAALGTQWATSQLLAESCLANAADVGTLVGTAFVARDMMQIVDALGEDGMLRYWGLSYGTVLGATVAAMFPDRMDRIMLDGVLNPFEYYHGYDIEMLTDTDKTFAGFISGCVAAPDQCALARDNATAADLEKTISDLIDTLKYNPVALGGILIDYSLIKEVILGYLYSPLAWDELAGGLNGLITGNITALAEFAEAFGARPQGIAAESYPAIKCADNAVRATTLADVRPAVDELYAKSRYGGDKISAIAVRCAQWRMDAKERYSGDFRVKTRNPVLLVGNTLDPVTPLVSARNVSEAFEGSVVLQHDGYGHSSLAQASICTTKAIRNFFINGTMPEPGTICKVDTPLFSNKTWQDVLPPIQRVRRSISARDDDDAALLRAASVAGKKLLRPSRFV